MSSIGSYKTVNIISQEVFEKIAPKAPRKANPEVPPPPPAVDDVEVQQVTFAPVIIIISNNFFENKFFALIIKHVIFKKISCFLKNFLIFYAKKNRISLKFKFRNYIIF